MPGIADPLRGAGPVAGSLAAVPDSLAALSAQQCGVMSRRQLLHAGFANEHVRAAIRSRKWQAFGRRVVVLHNAGLTGPQREWVAVLMPGKPTALAGITAAMSYGLKGFSAEHVHIVLSVHHRTHVPDWVCVHQSRRFGPADVDPIARPPRVHKSRAVIDAATWSPSALRAAAIVRSAVRQHVATSGDLLAELRRAGRIRHAALLRDVLGELARSEVAGAGKPAGLADVPAARRPGAHR
jgi:hypothetical protein